MYQERCHEFFQRREFLTTTGLGHQQAAIRELEIPPKQSVTGWEAAMRADGAPTPIETEYEIRLLGAEPSGKYSPLDVALWLETAALAAARYMREAESKAGKLSGAPEFRRMLVDVAMQSGIGLFFAWKMRSALLWELYERSGDSSAGDILF